MPTRKPKPKIERRQPAVISVPDARPADNLFNPFKEAKAAQEPRPSTVSRASTPSRGSTSIAPERDFHKVANSIVRDVLPTGQFSGKSKQLYDYLYKLTRGAIQPRRSVCLTKVKLMVGAGIGSEVTLRANLVKLKSMCLVDENVIPGTHGGNEYTVYLPEEGRASTPSRPSSNSSTSQFLEPLEALETTPSSISLNEAATGTSDEPKTFIKTNDRSDDEPLAELVAKFQQASREATGKEATAAERAKWSELADLLVAEFKIAAARTESVSSVPAFLTEHLRRRLWKKDKAQLDREEANAPELKQEIDASKCPDCGGSGWWYPEGPEKGVAKCRHTKVSPP